MKRLILKFGGTSVGTIEKIKKVANIIKKRFSEGNEIIVVVSAMSGVTDELKVKSDSISKSFDNKELDVLLSSGEQVSCSLLSGALIDLGVKARSWLGWQIPIVTNDNYTSSQIMKIKTDEILNFISKKGVAVIAGFQGISQESRITTLGRGGSDLSAVAIAKFFQTDACEIYTDVDGVFTTDPSINEKAKKIDKISYDEMMELSGLGARVLQPSAAQAAMAGYGQVGDAYGRAAQTGLAGMHQYPSIMAAPMPMYGAMGDVGAQRRAMAQESINQAMQKYEYGATAPQTALQNYMAGISGEYGGQQAARQSALQSAGQLGSLMSGLGMIG